MSVVYSMLLGIWGTIILHIAKSMQSQGMDQKRKRLYIVGLCLDITSVVWLTVANLFGPPSYYTSMYGFGLLVLMAYSGLVRKEKITKMEYAAAFVLVLGTGIMGIDGLITKQPDFSLISETRILCFTGIFVSIGGVACLYISRKNRPTLIGITFGFFSGGFAALEPVLRAVGQNKGGRSTFFPSVIEGWPIFIGSFLGGLFALILTQWGFSKKAKASTMIPTFNCVYIILPAFIQLNALDGYKITFFIVIGMVLAMLGVVWLNLIQIKNRKEIVIFQKENEGNTSIEENRTVPVK